MGVMPILEAESAEGGKTRGYSASGVHKTEGSKLTLKQQLPKAWGAQIPRPQHVSEVRCGISIEGLAGETTVAALITDSSHLHTRDSGVHAFEGPLLVCLSKAHIEVAYHANPEFRAKGPKRGQGLGFRQESYCRQQ